MGGRGVYWITDFVRGPAVPERSRSTRVDVQTLAASFSSTNFKKTATNKVPTESSLATFTILRHKTKFSLAPDGSSEFPPTVFFIRTQTVYFFRVALRVKNYTPRSNVFSLCGQTVHVEPPIVRCQDQRHNNGTRSA